ncbi:unnamed protein product [Rotaria sordida]|uniref:Uncharacterized protein n=1 Tax=Rotaria sordida TaxID=392033 RepID=A0A815K427_9BILA|nr:unnamed protein product [Rotaria sordida]
MSNLSIRMINSHTFSLVQTFFSMLTIEWTVFEILTSSNVMPVLRRANVSLFININDLNCISSSGIFTDHRHVDVHFAFNLLNCPPYTKVTPCIPRGNRFHSREIVGATFVVNHWSPRSEWLIDSDPFATSSLRDFGFYFRRKFSSLDDDMKTTFEDHTKFIKQLCDQILLLCLDKQLHYSIEDDGCGLTMWF